MPSDRDNKVVDLASGDSMSPEVFAIRRRHLTFDEAATKVVLGLQEIKTEEMVYGVFIGVPQDQDRFGLIRTVMLGVGEDETRMMELSAYLSAVAEHLRKAASSGPVDEHPIPDQPTE